MSTESSSIGSSASATGVALQAHFPIFSDYKARHGRRLAYLDSAASAQKPQRVLDRLYRALALEHANIHRGAYELSASATERFDAARAKIARFIGARKEREVIFTRGATEALNLVAYSLDRWFQPGDTVLLTMLEHHSNIVPWQLLAARRGVRVVFADINEDATLKFDNWLELLRTHKPKLVSFTMLSNAFGTLLPVSEMVAEARKVGAKIVLDAAQSVCHQRLNVSELGADFLVFSGHKLYGPTGIGALYVREENYAIMDPFQGGGDMIELVTTEGSTWAEPPSKFEAGTPAIAEAIALGEAVDQLEEWGLERLIEHERQVHLYGVERLRALPGVTLHGPVSSGKPQESIIAFSTTVHPHDLATVADSYGVCIRAGHHCAQPALRRLGLQATARASVGIYTEPEDFDQLAEAILAAQRIIGG